MEERVVMGFIVMILVIMVNIPRQRNSSSSRMKTRKRLKRTLFIMTKYKQTHKMLKRTLFIMSKHDKHI